MNYLIRILPLLGALWVTTTGSFTLAQSQARDLQALKARYGIAGMPIACQAVYAVGILIDEYRSGTARSNQLVHVAAPVCYGGHVARDQQAFDPRQDRAVILGGLSNFENVSPSDGWRLFDDVADEFERAVRQRRNLYDQERRQDRFDDFLKPVTHCNGFDVWNRFAIYELSRLRHVYQWSTAEAFYRGELQVFLTQPLPTRTVWASTRELPQQFECAQRALDWNDDRFSIDEKCRRSCRYEMEPLNLGFLLGNDAQKRQIVQTLETPQSYRCGGQSCLIRPGR